MAKEPNPVCGTLAIAVGPEGPLAFGVVSIPRLENMDPLIEEPEDKEQQPGQPTHTRLPGMIGRFELGAGFHVDQLFEKSAFEAGLRQGDVLRSIDGKEIMGDQDFYSQTFSQHALVRLQVVREGKPLDLTIPFVSRRDLGYNVRSSDFPVTFEIAAAVSANDCGAQSSGRMPRHYHREIRPTRLQGDSSRYRGAICGERNRVPLEASSDHGSWVG
jgi:hypothetical protein